MIKLKKAIAVMAAVAIVSGCSTMGQKNKANLQRVDLGGIPEYYLQYKGMFSQDLKDGQFVATGYGKDDSLTIALEKAILDAEVSAARSINSNVVRSVSKRYVESSRNMTEGNEKSSNQQSSTDKSSMVNGIQNDSNVSSSYYNNATETVIDNINVGGYRVIKKDIFERNGAYEVYVLISNAPDMMTKDAKTVGISSKLRREIGTASQNLSSAYEKQIATTS